MLFLIEKFEKEMLELKACRERITELAKRGESDKARLLFEEEYSVMIEGVAKTGITTWEMAENNAKSFVENAKKTRVHSVILMDSVFVTILLVTIVLAVCITKSITSSIKETLEIMQKVSKGNLEMNQKDEGKDELAMLKNTTIDVVSGLQDIIKDISYHLGEIAKGDIDLYIAKEYKGDFKPIKESVEKITKDLSEMFVKINQASDQVEAGSLQIANGGQLLSEGATQQATDINIFSNKLNEVLDDIKENTIRANESCRLSDTAAEALMLGNEEMKELTLAMREIKEAAKEIEEITEEINAIAFQTNILALNASVEAARAGDLGKGFAVVATKVKDLANESDNAASRTGEIVSITLKNIERACTIADKTEKTLDEVMEAAKKATDIIGQISGISKKQESVVEESVGQMKKILDVVYTNTATAEESAAASEQLTGQVALLKQLIGVFRLKGESVKRNLKNNFI